jgi:hypothetical protein
MAPRRNNDDRPLLFPKPTKADRPGVKRRKEIKKKDIAWQKDVSPDGTCFNCRHWKPLGGDHAIKRRFLKTRHDPANRRECCWTCNVDLESLSLAQLIEKYPLSPLQQDWRTKKEKMDLLP